MWGKHTRGCLSAANRGQEESKHQPRGGGGVPEGAVLSGRARPWRRSLWDPQTQAGPVGQSAWGEGRPERTWRLRGLCCAGRPWIAYADPVRR